MEDKTLSCYQQPAADCASEPSHLLPSALGHHPSSVPRSSWETVLGKDTKFIMFGQRSHYDQNDQAVLLKLLLTKQLEQKKMTVNHSLRTNRRAEI